MSAGSHSHPAALSGEAAERQQPPSHPQARSSPGRTRATDGYGPVPAAAQASGEPYASRQPAFYQSDYSPKHSNAIATREAASRPNGDRPSLPSINQLVAGPLSSGLPPAAATQVPVSSGPGPPTSYYASTRPDPRTFSEPPRPALGSRAPPPPPLDLHNAQHAPTAHNGHQPASALHDAYRGETAAGQALETSSQHYTGGYSNGYGLPPSAPPSSAHPSNGHHVSRPPSRGPYPTSTQLPPGQYPLPPVSPRHHPSTTLPPPFGNHDAPARYEHRGASPGYSHVAPGPGQGPAPAHDRYERPVDRGFGWDYEEHLERIKTYSHSILHFADSYIRAAREQNGGHPIQSRLPSEGEIRNLVDHTYIIKTCLQDINRMVPESQPSMENERGDRPVEHKEQSMVTYSHQQHMPMQPQQHAIHTPLQTSQPPSGHHGMPPQLLAQMPPHAQHPHQQIYSLSEHKLHNKRRGVSLEPPPPGRGSAPRYADPPRKRAAPPGRCHSCNRVDTPEWRRGPDGARTLCNACGLHYAKLERKKASELKSIRPKPASDSGRTH